MVAPDEVGFVAVVWVADSPPVGGFEPVQAGESPANGRGIDRMRELFGGCARPRMNTRPDAGSQSSPEPPELDLIRSQDRPSPGEPSPDQRSSGGSPEAPVAKESVGRARRSGTEFLAAKAVAVAFH